MSQESRVVRIETWADHGEFADVKQELEKVFGLRTRAELFYPTKKLAATGMRFAAPPPYEVFIQVITTLGSIAGLADILYRFLKKPVPKGVLGATEPRSATLKLDGKEITVKGDWTQDDLKLILETFSKQITNATDLSLLEKSRRNELEQELSEIRKNIPSYERLVKIGSKSRKKEWKQKLKEYQARLQELEARAEAIRELLEKDKVLEVR